MPSSVQRASGSPASRDKGFFRHHGWLAPGIRLFRRLGFTAKAAWVSGAFLLPLGIALWSLVATAMSQVEVARSERAGVAYLRPALTLLEAAQARRTAALAGSADLDADRAKVEAAHQALLAGSQATSTEFKLDKFLDELKAAHARVNSPESRGLEPDATFELHTGYIDAVLRLVRQVANASQLTLDPDLDTFHLMNISVLRGPTQYENTARLRAVGGLVLSKGELSEQRRTWLTEWSAVWSYIDEDVEGSYLESIAADPVIASLMDMEGTDAASDDFRKAIAQQLLGSAPSGSAAEFDAKGDRAVALQRKLTLQALDRLDAQLQARIDRVERALAEQLLASLLGVVLAAYLLLAFYRVMTGGMSEVTNHLREITRGNLTTVPRPWGRDEAAELMITLGEMQASLRRIVGTVLEGAAQVQAASTEIASASDDLSRRTEQSAASLQQTSASMSQIADSVQQSRDTVQDASRHAQQNAESARLGGQAIAEVVSTMQDIRSSSGRISEIIGVIDGIAFQTNILALNAAVEAARAGEHGRGFAVVASEVRALAGRSSTAAREIKQLIQSSLEHVESGGTAVERAGEIMQDLLGSAENISQQMSQIAGGVTEQARNIGEVSSAVHSMDESTQQNAALVEQTASASGTLASQAGRLNAEVSFFRLP